MAINIADSKAVDAYYAEEYSIASLKSSVRSTGKWDVQEPVTLDLVGGFQSLFLARVYAQEIGSQVIVEHCAIHGAMQHPCEGCESYYAQTRMSD